MKNLWSMRSLGPIVAASMALGLGACAEQVGPPSSTSMQLGAATMAPRGYLQFCLRRPDQCGLHTPVADIQHEAFQAALNREEWSNVLSLGSREPQTSAAPSEVGPVLLTRDAEVQPPLSQATDGAARTALGPGLIVPERLASDTEDAIPSRPLALLITLVPTNSSRVGAPRLEDLFQDVHHASAPTVLHYNQALWAHLEAVNADINVRIRPRTDLEAFGTDDYWTLPLDVGGRGEGNCKHYALEKRRRLVEGGMSEDALSLAIVRTPRGETHAVLVVATDHGDFVLDNLTPEIRGWRETGYTWLARQTPGDPLRWAMVQGASAGA